MGGDISGNWDIGRLLIAKIPMNIITREITMANTGLCINSLNILLV